MLCYCSAMNRMMYSSMNQNNSRNSCHYYLLFTVRTIQKTIQNTPPALLYNNFSHVEGYILYYKHP